MERNKKLTNNARVLRKQMTKEEAEEYSKNYTFKTGKHAGMTLEEIIKNKDNSFMDWILDKSNDNRLKEAVKLLANKEELTPEEQKEKVDLIDKIMNLSYKKNIDIEEIREKFAVEELSEMTIDQMKKCVVALEKAERKE